MTSEFAVVVAPIVLTLVGLLLHVGDSAPGRPSVSEICAQQKPLVWNLGLRHAESFSPESRDRLLKCFGTTAANGQRKDAVMDGLRLEALQAILPKGTPRDKLSQTACVLMMAPTDGTSEIVKRKAIMMSCVQKELSAKGIDTPSLDIRAIQMKCLKCAFPKASDAEAVNLYKDVMQKFEKMEAEALRVSSELEAAMRFTLDDGPTMEMNGAARTTCLAQMAPGVKASQYLELVTSLMKKGDLNTKKKIDVCTYKNSLRGKWVQARQIMIQECALEAKKKLPAQLQNDLSFLYALHLNNTALKTYLTCAENEEDTIVDGPTGPTGYVDVYCTSHGRAPRKCPQCASEIYTTVDAGKVESTVDACYSKKEKAHPLYKEYAAYLEKVQQKTEAIEKCVYEVIGQKRSQAAVMKPKSSAASADPRKTRPTKG